MTKRFRAPERTIVIEFGEDTDWYGAEVVCRRNVSYSRLMWFEALQEASTVEDVAQRIREFGDEIVKSWNVDDEDGNEVPANGEGLLTMPVDFTMALVLNWSTGVTAVDAPLVDASVNGESPEEANDPTEAA